MQRHKQMSTQRRPSRTPGPAKRVSSLVSIAKYIDDHASTLDRLAALCVLLPLYVFTITVTYRGVSCVWDTDRVPIAWVAIPLSLFPMYVLPIGLALRLPFIWRPITRNCLYANCAPVQQCPEGEVVLAVISLLFATACAYLLTYILSAVKSRRSTLLNSVHYYAHSHHVARKVMDFARSRALERQRREDVLTERRTEELYTACRVPRSIAQLIAEMSRTDFEKLVPPSVGLDSGGADHQDANTSESDAHGDDGAEGISINDIHGHIRGPVTAAGNVEIEGRNSSPGNVSISINMV